MGLELTPQERIVKAKISFSKSHPFLGYVVLNMELQEAEKDEKKIPTMGVDKCGRLYWNEKFVK